MSFALTTPQILNRSKTVTRRAGWSFLKPGDIVCAVQQSQGLKKGETVRHLAVLRIERVDREPLATLRSRHDAFDECAREGFPQMTPYEFVEFFKATHPKVEIVTRIEFSYVEPSRTAL